MSSDLKDYLYLEAKEKAFEIEIEARKEFQKKRDQNIVEKKQALAKKFEQNDTLNETNYKQFANKREIEID